MRGWRKTYQSLTSLEKFLAIGVVSTILLRFGLVLFMPISFDEAFMQIFSIRPGMWHAWTVYDVPNNHILYSILVALLPEGGSVQTVVLRLPALLFSVGSSWLFYRLIRLQVNHSLALASTWIFSAIPVMLYYGYMARGYSMALFFSLWAIYGGVKWLNSNRWKDGIQVSTALALGVFVLPSQVYFNLLFGILTLTWILVRLDAKTALRALLWLVVGAVLTGLLYLPTLLVSGWDSLTDNQYVKVPTNGVGWSEWRNHWVHTVQYYLGYPALALLALGAVFARKTSAHKDSMILSGAFLVLLLLIPIAHQRIPFPRTWIFALPVFLSLVILGLSVAWNKRLGLGMGVLAALISVWGVYQVHWSERGSFEARDLYESMVEQDIHSAYINHPLLSTLLRYHFEQKNPEYEYAWRFAVNRSITAEELEAAQKEYDLVLLEGVPYENVNPAHRLDTSSFYSIYIGPNE